jgi:hypothetical protein
MSSTPSASCLRVVSRTHDVAFTAGAALLYRPMFSPVPRVMDLHCQHDVVLSIVPRALSAATHLTMSVAIA